MPNSATRPWLAGYPNSVPAEIDVPALPTIAELIIRSSQEFAEKPAFISFGKTLTYREIGTAARAVAGYLQAQGFKKGDRIEAKVNDQQRPPRAPAHHR